MKTENDVVVTGMGIVSPIGVGIDSFTDSLMTGKSGIKLRDDYAGSDWRFRIGGMVEGFDAKQYVKPRKSLKLMCREIQFGFGAAQIAVEDSGLDLEQIDSRRIGIVCGSDTYYCDPRQIADSYWDEGRGVTEISEWILRAMKTVEPLWMLKYLPNMTASHVAISIDAQGPNNTIIQGDASGLLALIEAADAIRRGWTDVMLVGGTGSKTNPTYMCYHSTNELADPGDDPATACKPFDKNRTGTVCSEGSGMLVIERRKNAEARGARIYAKLGAFDYGFGGVTESDRTNFLSLIINRVIERAGLEKNQVSHVNSHGSGEVGLDRIIAQSIHRSLDNVGVTAYKSFFGDLGPAAGIIESCASLKAFQDKIVPGTIGFETSDEMCPVNIIRENLEQEPTAVVKTSSSKNGQMAVVLFEAD